jgi:hypothetical protein
MQKAFDGADRFFPITTRRHGGRARGCQGSPAFDKSTHEKESAREAAEAAAKKK